MAQLQGTVDDLMGRPLVSYVRVFSTRCVQCGEVILGDVECLALGKPANGLVHLQCAPHYNYANIWPHPAPAIAYNR